METPYVGPEKKEKTEVEEDKLRIVREDRNLYNGKIINKIHEKLIHIKEAQESECENEQKKGNIKGADEEVDNKKKNTEEEEGQDVIWQSQDKEEERVEPVLPPSSEECSNTTQVETEGLEEQTLEDRLIELEEEGKKKKRERFLKMLYLPDTKVI